jgi:cytochrome c
MFEYVIQKSHASVAWEPITKIMGSIARARLKKTTRPWRAAILLSLASTASAQFSHPGCGPVQASDFTAVTLVSNATNASTSEPMKMALHKNAQGHVDVYFTQRLGLVRRYNGATGTITQLMQLSPVVSGGNSEGLNGIALDPAFATNGWIYLFIGSRTIWNVSRFTLSGNTINPSSEREILRITTTTTRRHATGSLRFDRDGNLWISVADNEEPYTAANTNSYLGKILRIKPRAFADDQTPQPGLGSTYDVPTGNLFPPNTAQTLPEIYAMGLRNPFTLSLDSARRAVTWGDVGPDVFSVGSTNPSQWTEEHNFTTQPGNFGSPYWAGNQISVTSGGGTPQSPVNNHNTNTGLTALPPALPALNSYARDCAITGPVYYYDSTNTSRYKFPPHFHGAWFVADFNRSYIQVLGLNPTGTQIQGTPFTLMSGLPLDDPMELEMGPDGALYVINYAGYRTTTARTGILRIEYQGACKPTVSLAARKPPGEGVAFDGRFLRIIAAGGHAAELRDLSGRLVWSRKGTGVADYDLQALGGPGLRILTATTPLGSFSAKVPVSLANPKKW